MPVCHTLPLGSHTAPPDGVSKRFISQLGWMPGKPLGFPPPPSSTAAELVPILSVLCFDWNAIALVTGTIRGYLYPLCLMQSDN